MATKIAGLPIQKEWTVLKVKEGAVEDNPNGPGELQKFFVDFDGAPDVYWRRKLPATVEVGKSYFGTISEGNFGPIFKKENPGQGNGGGGGGGGGGRSSSSGGGNGGWQPESQRDPEKTARIGRSHAQHMAILTCQAMGLFESVSATQIESKIKGWTDFYEKDVNATGQKAGGTATALAATSDGSDAAPAQTSEGEDPQWVLKVCEDSGLSSYPAGKLAQFIGRLNAEQQGRAVNGLASLETQGEVLGQLKKAYEEAEGEPLPDSDPSDNDIPF